MDFHMGDSGSISIVVVVIDSIGDGVWPELLPCSRMAHFKPIQWEVHNINIHFIYLFCFFLSIFIYYVIKSMMFRELFSLV